MTLRKLTSLAATCVALALPLATPAIAADSSAPPSGPTRAQVRADLEAWDKSGLRQIYRGDGGPPFFDPNIQRRQAEYQRLRDSAEAALPATPATAPGPR